MSRFMQTVTFMFLVGLPCAGWAQTAPAGMPVNEAYRLRFADCDAHDSFNGVQFPIKAADGKVVWFGCHRDQNNFARFERVPPGPGGREAIVLSSKLGHDEDGSDKACHHAGGPTDQCGTALMLRATATHPCLVTSEPASRCVPVNPDAVPYVVIPGFGPKGIDSHEFQQLSGLRVGDYGFVLANGREVPVIIADTGPAYKIGEGSTALLRALAADGTPRTIERDVMFVLLPGTRDVAATLDPDTLPEVVKQRGAANAAVLHPKP